MTFSLPDHSGCFCSLFLCYVDRLVHSQLPLSFLLTTPPSPPLPSPPLCSPSTPWLCPSVSPGIFQAPLVFFTLIPPSPSRSRLFPGPQILYVPMASTFTFQDEALICLLNSCVCLKCVWRAAHTLPVKNTDLAFLSGFLFSK